MFLAIEQLRESIKTYTVAQTVALASNAAIDIDYANKVLSQINTLRLNIAIEAEMREIFWAQVDIPVAANVNTVQNNWFSKNDRAFLIRRGIAALDAGAQVSLVNQGEKQRTITRESVAWQQLFSSVQSVALGQQIPFDLPETLRFGENQSLNVAIQGESTGVGSVPQGYLFLHGATTKENIDEATIQNLQDEFIDKDGNTIYLPETQIVPLLFQFPDGATVGTYATDPNGSENIFSVKSEKSVLLTRVSSSQTLFRIDKLTDEGRNQTLCERIEVQGVASDMTNPFTTFYDLPFPHLLRRGDRLKGIFQDGSILSDGIVEHDVLTYLTFEGITI